VKVVLDTSALLCHYFDEPGAERVESLIAEAELHIASPTLFEFVTVAVGRGVSRAEAEEALDSWIELAGPILSVTDRTARVALDLRHGTPSRIPSVDCFIAAAARELDGVLVHRDEHLRVVPAELVRQEWLGGPA
jgi:predicted nucleic acid-binding protein